MFPHRFKEKLIKVLTSINKLGRILCVYTLTLRVNFIIVRNRVKQYLHFSCTHTSLFPSCEISCCVPLSLFIKSTLKLIRIWARQFTSVCIEIDGAIYNFNKFKDSVSVRYCTIIFLESNNWMNTICSGKLSQTFVFVA